LDRFIAWRTRRRHFAHLRWLRKNRVVVFAKPERDERDWSGTFTRGLKR
jgi:hypothetical protein